MSSEEIVCVKDFKERARKRLTPSTWHFIDNGSGCEQTYHDNEVAFSRWRFRPRLLRDVSCRTLSTTVLGDQIDFPVGISPSALHKLVHPEGELATVKAAASMNVIMILSTVASSSLEEVAQTSPNCIRWFQLYIAKDRSLTESLVKRAEYNGYKALVLTVDAQYFGIRWEVLRHKSSVPRHIRYGNFQVNEKEEINIQKFADATFDPKVTWRDVQWLKSITSLPIVVKGILTPEDAELALQHGADAIMVSNHGGRQLDGVLPTIDVLPEIIKAVNGRCEVYVDSGVTMGTDVLKALALGARAVFIGRPALWGLTCQGEEGVRKVLEILKRELDNSMALAGVSNVNDVSPSLVYRSPPILAKL